MKSERKKNYHNYLKSEWWNEIKERKIKKAKSCFICHSSESLLVHHFSYKDIYKPKTNSASKNTVVICFQCHEAVHREQWKRNCSYEETREIVAQMKSDYSKAIKLYKLLNEEFKSNL